MTPLAKTLLITGGAGYVGSALVRDALAGGYKVRVLDLLVYGGGALVGFLNHPRFELLVGDIRDRETVRQALADVDCVVHLAAVVGDRPCQAAARSAYQINFSGTKLVAEEAKRCGIQRFVFASTCSNYGITNTETGAHICTYSE